MTNTTRAVAEFVLRTGFDDLPEDVLHEGARAFLNILGCAFGGSSHAMVDIALAMADEFSGPRTNAVIGRDLRLDTVNGALINCLAMSAHVFDDTHLETVIHPTGPVAAALLALAEREKKSGAEVLAALVLGIEVECRLARALFAPPAKGEFGWYLTGVVCGIGAAVGAAKLLGLDVENTAQAIGIAAVQSGGFRETHGTMCVAYVPANAARSGLTAAMLAQRGFSSSETALEGVNGFAQVFAPEANLAAVTDGLGARWEVLSNAYKPYPCGIVIHPVIDICLDLAREPGFDPAAVRRVRLRVNPYCIALCDRPEPAGNAQAQVSVQHWTAAALLRGRAGIPEGADDCVRDPEIIALRNLVETQGDESVPPEAAFVTLDLADGSVLERQVETCIGCLARPMTDGELEAKFLAQSVPVIGEDRSRSLIAQCWALPDSDDAAALLQSVGK